MWAGSASGAHGTGRTTEQAPGVSPPEGTATWETRLEPDPEEQGLLNQEGFLEEEAPELSPEDEQELARPSRGAVGGDGLF